MNDLSYMAGFFDGEGTISIHKRKKKNWNWTHYLRASIAQKDGAIMDWIKERFGGGVFFVKRDNVYLWVVTDKAAYIFCKEIAPFLKYKKPQAELAIKFYEERIIPNKNRNKNNGILQSEIDLREQMRLDMSSLKKVFLAPASWDKVQVQRLSESTSKEDAIV